VSGGVQTVNLTFAPPPVAENRIKFQVTNTPCVEANVGIFYIAPVAGIDTPNITYMTVGCKVEFVNESLLVNGSQLYFGAFQNNSSPVIAPFTVQGGY
jgi:hypothetical protein